MSFLSVVLCVGLLTNASWAQVAPANDNFASAQDVTALNGGLFGSVTNDTTSATAEFGEPSHAGFPAFRTVWYKWTAPQDGEVQLDTLSSPTGTDTLLAVYGGSTLSTLRQVAANDDLFPAAQYNTSTVTSGFGFGAALFRQPFSGPSGLRFNARIGTTYYFAVGSKFAGRPIALGWAYHASGVFRFATEDAVTSFVLNTNTTPPSFQLVTTPVFQASEFESLGDEDASTFETYYQFGVPGMLVTVTRLAGASGRMLVDYATEDVDVTNTLANDVPAVAGVDYLPVQGTLVFDDYEMTKRIMIPVFWDGFFAQSNRNFAIVLTNARPDAAESPNVSPPRIDGAYGRALVRILDTDIDPVLFRNFQEDTNAPNGYVFQTTNSVFNFSRVSYRTVEDVNSYWTYVRIWIDRSGTNREGVTLHYRVNNFLGSGDNADPAEQDNDFFPLQPGSDYATPLPVDDTNGLSQIGIHGRDADFATEGIDGNNYTFPNGGTIDWGQNDFRSKSIAFVITNDTLTEFNEDWHVFLYRNDSDGNPYLVGTVNEANVTILYDDQDPPAGSVDQYHNPDFGAHMVPPVVTVGDANRPHPGADGAVYGLVVQPDNKTVIVGDFLTYNAGTRNRIARINVDGSLDTSFTPGVGANNSINAIVRTSSGQFVIGGGFSSYNGTSRPNVARLNDNGALDAAFNPVPPNGTVWAVAVQQDAKVIIAGDFTLVGGTPRARIARFEANGLLDPTFDPGPNGPDGTIWTVALQNDGKIVVGGEFANISGQGLGGIARLNSNGTLDATFDPGAGTDGIVYALGLQTDGKVLVGGAFHQMDFNPRKNLTRLNSDGSLDMSFDPGSGGTDDTVYSIAVSSAGIYIGGRFTIFNGTHRLGFARLYSNGILDTGFLDTAYNQFAGLHRARFSDAAGVVFASGVQSDGRVMIAGSFEQVGGGQNNDRFIRPDTDDFNLWLEPKARDGVRNRRNVARLIGGSTAGPGNISLASTSTTANENASSVSVSLTRANGTLGFLSANFEIEEGLAQSGVDYIYNAVPPIYLSSWEPYLLGFQASQPNASTRMHSDGLFGDNFVPTDIYGHNWYSYTPGDLVITLLDDNLSQGDRNTTFRLANPLAADQFFLGGENIPLGGALGLSQVPFTILDDDKNKGVLSFAAVNFVVNEDVTNAVITVVRTNGSFGTVSCQFSTIVGGNATSGVDYFATNGTLTLGPGVTNRSFTIRIVDDSAVEDDETIFLRLSGATGGATLGLTNAIVTIIDNDLPGGRVKFSSANYSTNENDVAAIMTVTRSGSSAGTLTVQAGATNGTAIEGVNFTGVTNTLMWASGNVTPKTFIVPLIDDVQINPDRTVNLRLFNSTLNGSPNPASLGPTSTATLTILNDDFSGRVGLSTSVYNANENGGPAIITVVRTGGSAESVTINFSASGGTAVPGADFSPTNGTLVFGPGELSKSFTVPIFNNSFQDAARFVTLTLSGASPAGALGFPSTAIINIVDDESFNEPPGGSDTVFTPSGMNDAVLTLALQSDGKIIAGGDFSVVNSVPRVRMVRLNAVDGSVDNLFQPSANGSVRSLIAQGDGKTLMAGAFTTVNSVVRNYIARVNSNGSLDTTFNPGSGVDTPLFATAEAFSNGQRKIYIGGGFTAFNNIPRNGIARLNNDGTLDSTFDPGLGANGIVYSIAAYPTNTTHAGKVLIGGDFTSANGIGRNRIARLNADGSLDASFNPGIGASDAVRAIAIQSDGRILIGGSFTNYNGTAMGHFARLNADGTLDATFTPGPGANDTVGSITIQGDTRIVLGGQFTRCNGVTRNHITRLNNDGTVDPTINFGSGANDFVAATLVQPDGKIVIGGGFTEYNGVPHQRIARIYGGSVAGSGTLEFTAADYQVDENGTNAVVTVRRRGGTSGAPGSDNISVDVVTSDGSATNGVHYIGGTSRLIFPPGEVFQTLLIPVSDDLQINTNRIFHLSLENLMPPGAPALGNQPTATVTIINDDSTISFAATAYTVNEAVVGGLATISIARAGSTRGVSSVDFITTTNGTATVGLDFQIVSNTVTFAQGETLKTVTVPIVNDLLVEGNESIIMQLINPNGALLIAPNQAVLTIVDDDLGPGRLAFSSNAFFASEISGNAVISVIRTNGSSGIASVKFSTSGGTAVPGLDYAVTNGTLVFANGETNKQFSVPLLRNPMVTGDLTVNLQLSDPITATLIEPSTAVLTIHDVDTGFRFSSPAYAALETSGSVVVSVQRIGGTNSAVSVSYVTTNGSALAGTHYVQTSGTLNFAPGEILKTFSVPVLHNPAVEGNLVFYTVLSSPSPGTQLANPGVAAVTVIDVDTGFSFGPFTNSVAENGTNIIVPVIRTGNVVGQASVNYATADGTAVLGADYAPQSGTLLFEDGEALKTIVIPILDDRAAEGDEEFFVTLGGPSAGAQVIAPGITNVVILDNDSGFRFSSAAYAVSEGGVSAFIAVLRTGTALALSNTVAVNFATSDGTATAGLDYLATNGVFTFTNGETFKWFFVRIIDDTDLEGDETVNLTLTNAVGDASLVEPGSATLTLIDNDGSLIVGAGSALTAESGPANGVIDPGETVTLLFALRNTAGARSTNLTATLLATNGVTAPSGPQNYGALEVGGPSVSRPFRFTASGTNGATLLAVLQLSDGELDLKTVVFAYTLGSATLSFTNGNTITILDATNSAPLPASPYPSTISVGGLAGVVSQATVTFTNFNHGAPSDVQALLVSPSGQRLTLMANAGGFSSANRAALTFDDSAPGPLPTPIVSGTYNPSTFGTPAPFPSPAPSAPHGTTLSVLNGTNPNGTWSLYVVDKATLDSGAISNGWILTLTVAGVVPAAADLSIGVTPSPGPVIVTSNLTYTVTVTNHGPSGATSVVVTNPLPPGLTFISAAPSGGSASTNAAGELIWNVGTLAKDAAATLTVVARARVGGAWNLTASTIAAQSDPNTANNAASQVVNVSSPTANLAIGVIGIPNPVTLGSTVKYVIGVTNLGPASATQVAVTNRLPTGFSVVSTSPGGTNVIVAGSTVTFPIPDDLGSNGVVSLSIDARPPARGTFTNTVSVGSTVVDPLKANNTASVKTEVESPEISVSRSGASLVIAWPVDATAYILESTDSLSPPGVWTQVTSPPPQTSGVQRFVTVPIGAGNQYFRLRAPIQ